MRRKAKFRRVVKTMLYSLTTIVVFLSMGLGYSTWTTSLAVGGSVETGFVKTEFADNNILPDSNDESVDAIGKLISYSSNEESIPNKKMDIMLTEVNSNSAVNVEFAVKNTGSMPVKCEQIPVDPAAMGDLAEPITVTINCPEDINSGEIQSGSLIITFGEVEEGTQYDVPVRLKLSHETWADILEFNITVKTAVKPVENIEKKPDAQPGNISDDSSIPKSTDESVKDDKETAPVIQDDKASPTSDKQDENNGDAVPKEGENNNAAPSDKAIDEINPPEVLLPTVTPSIVPTIIPQENS